MKNPILAVEGVVSQIAALKQEFPQLADDDDLLADTLEGETDLHRVVSKLVTMVRESDMMQAALAARIQDLGERRTRQTMRMNFYRGLIHRLMIAANSGPIATVEGKVSVANSPDKVIITDEAAIPDEFMRIKREPDRTLIKKALNANIYVPGATLSNGGTTIVIR
jgi:hypothetical protein